MVPTWGRQDPGGPHVGHMNLAIWAIMNFISGKFISCEVNALTTFQYLTRWILFCILHFQMHSLELKHCILIKNQIKFAHCGPVDNNSSLSGEPDYFGRNKISSGGDLSHYSSASLY